MVLFSSFFYPHLDAMSSFSRTDIVTRAHVFMDVCVCVLGGGYSV